MIRTLAKAFTMSVLAFVPAVPVGAIASNGSEVIIGNSESGEVFTMQPNWLANEKDLKALDAKLAMVKSDLNQKVARVESTLTGQIASLKRELQELRARAESKGMESRMEPNGNGEPGMGKPSSKANGSASKANGSNLSALNARIAEIEKSLNEMVAKVKELRTTVQDLQVRADSKNRLARTGR